MNHARRTVPLGSRTSASKMRKPGRRVPRTGGVILARSGDMETLREAMLEDPFVRHEAATFEIIEFTPSMTAAGAEVFKVL